ncbi:hypothetical protein VCSRO106_3356 [Vibrio cholerae]|nr:hypothetical protein VCSRO103_3336 [Vibrio cholerae]GHX15108.1 hypothetical protein VCSRO106_3356 [Vibrio cholerae]GIA28378.1 hypothetical protein VCSRO85_1559 [Vibrio cholerae]
MIATLPLQVKQYSISLLPIPLRLHKKRNPHLAGFFIQSNSKYELQYVDRVQIRECFL